MSEFIGTCVYFMLGIIALPAIIAYFILGCFVCLLIDLGEYVGKSFVHTFKYLTQEVR